MCFLPATFELGAYLLFAPQLLGISPLEAGIIGAIMGAVSPAVVIPRMTKLIEDGWGTQQGIPQMIVAGASADDVYVVVLFTSLVTLASGGSVAWTDFAAIPVSIVSGILFGCLVGMAVIWIFDHWRMRATRKCVMLLATAFLLVSMENALKGIFPFSGYLAVISMGMCVCGRRPAISQNLSGKLEKLWVGAELFLFVLVGAAANPAYAFQSGLMIIVMLLIGLVFRSVGTWTCLLGTHLNRREKVFVMLAEIPKATVQAAIGSIPLAMGLDCGVTALSAAILAIFVTAPLGALAIDLSYSFCLKNEYHPKEARRIHDGADGRVYCMPAGHSTLRCPCTQYAAYYARLCLGIYFLRFYAQHAGDCGRSLLCWCTGSDIRMFRQPLWRLGRYASRLHGNHCSDVPRRTVLV